MSSFRRLGDVELLRVERVRQALPADRLEQCLGARHAERLGQSAFLLKAARFGDALSRPSDRHADRLVGAARARSARASL
jgi:hypothetical protein